MLIFTSDPKTLQQNSPFTKMYFYDRIATDNHGVEYDYTSVMHYGKSVSMQ